MANDEPFYTTFEAALLLGMHPGSIRRLCAKNLDSDSRIRLIRHKRRLAYRIAYSLVQEWSMNRPEQGPTDRPALRGPEEPRPTSPPGVVGAAIARSLNGMDIASLGEAVNSIADILHLTGSDKPCGGDQLRNLLEASLHSIVEQARQGCRQQQTSRS